MTTPDSRSSTSPEEARFDVFVLGRAQDGGVPHLGCQKPCCAEARRNGRLETPACLGIHDRQTDRLVLVEATPSVETQVANLHLLSGQEGRTRPLIDAVLITHAHMGHYTGLMQFGREAASARNLPTYVTTQMATFLRDNGPWSQLVSLEQLELKEIESNGQRFEPIEGLAVEAIPVPHRAEFSDTVAFRIHGPTGTVLFCPDCDRWAAHEGLLESLLEGVDVAYLDGTFYDGSELPGRDLAEIPHPAIIDTMDRLQDEARSNPGSIRFLHLNHSNPALHDREIADGIAARGFRIAEPGEVVHL